MLVFKSYDILICNTYNLRCPWQPGVSSKMAPYFQRILRRSNVPFQAQAVYIHWVTPDLGWLSYPTTPLEKQIKNINQLKNSIFRGIRAIWYLFLGPPARETFFFSRPSGFRFPASFFGCGGPGWHFSCRIQFIQFRHQSLGRCCSFFVSVYTCWC